LTDLSDSCVLALEDGVSANYTGDIFSDADSYQTLSHILSPGVTQSSSAVQQQQQPPSTVQHQVTSNCHITVASTISAEQAPSLHALGRRDVLCHFKLEQFFLRTEVQF